MWPFLPNRTKKLAASFSEIASQDADASFQLFKLGVYAQAIYLFQQAVEKAGKAYGLLAGTARPTSHDLVGQVSHRSMLGITLRLPEMMERGPALREALRRSLDEAKLKGIGVWDVFEPILQKRESENPETARNTVRQIKALDPAKLWRISLELVPNHPFAKTVWKGLDEADRRNAEADDFEARILLPLRKFLGHPEDIGFVLNLYGRAGPELFPLTLVSMWHERETRYPPIERDDYWDPAAYTAHKGLVKNYELFHRHTARLCKAVKTASEAAVRHHPIESRRGLPGPGT